MPPKSSAGFYTPRPTSASASASTAAPKLPVPNPKSVAKCLAYDDNFTFPAAASDAVPEGLALQDGGLTPLLELPDPDDASSSTVVSAAHDDAVVASGVTEVAAPADSEAALPEHIELVLAELRGAGGLSPRSKRLIAALAEAAAAELAPTATSRRLRRAAFWRKVRVGVLAATVAAVAAIDVALMVALVSRRGNNHNHMLPPT